MRRILWKKRIHMVSNVQPKSLMGEDVHMMHHQTTQKPKIAKNRHESKLYIN